MSGQGDDQAERAILAALQRDPRDFIDLIAAVRKRLPDLLVLHEGALHAVLLRLVRSDKVVVGVPSARGLARYRLPDVPEPAPAGDPPALEPVDDPALARTALRVASSVRDPAARGRVQADVMAHLESLGEKQVQFGSARAARNLLHRVSRGKPAVCLAAGAGDVARRLVLHEGPWIAGAALIWVVLKVFVMQTYVIPSGSMVPTLLRGDRVVVFRFHEGEAPPRWTVATFEGEDKTLVKRLVGLPGEKVAILHGDVYANDTLLVKPDHLREALRQPMGTWDLRATEKLPGWRVGTSPDGRSRVWRSGLFEAHPHRPGMERGGVFPMHDGYARLALGRTDEGPVRLILTRGPGDRRDEGVDKGTIQWSLSLEGPRLRLEETRLDASGRGTAAAGDYLVDAPAPAGGTVLALSYVDGILRARAGDFAYEKPRPAPDGPLTVAVDVPVTSNGALQLAVDRDVHYAHLGEHAVPQQGTHGMMNRHLIAEGHLFFLGDNTTDSHDCRFSDLGDIPVSRVVGPVSFRIWPPSRWGRVR